MNKVTTLYAILLLSLIGLPTSYAQNIQRVRIDFQSPSGYLRPLLLAFTPDNAASDGMDYGYDALCPDDLPEDLNWMINNQRYVIQGVGEFSENKSYPFGMFLENSGNIEISLNSLENFENPINVYIYDALSNSFQRINDSGFSLNINNGDYLNRFFITFQNSNPPAGANNALSIVDNSIDKLIIKSILNTKEILITTKNSLKINKVEILDILGKKVSNI
ncbi:MAG: hypothetical protein DA407_10305, partial [Bacteroidetes bacterium]